MLTVRSTHAPRRCRAHRCPSVAIGQPLQLNRNVLGTKTVATIVVANPRYNVKSGNQFIKPSRGQFIVVDVAVQSTEGKILLTQGSFKLVGADGAVYDTTMSFVEPSLGFAELQSGTEDQRNRHLRRSSRSPDRRKDRPHRCVRRRRRRVLDPLTSARRRRHG